MGSIFGTTHWQWGNLMGGVFWVGYEWFVFGALVGGGRGRGRENTRGHVQQVRCSLDDASFQTDPFFMLYVVY